VESFKLQTSETVSAERWITHRSVSPRQLHRDNSKCLILFWPAYQYRQFCVQGTAEYIRSHAEQLLALQWLW